MSGVVAFPLYRRRKLVFGIASVLRATRGQSANQFWRETAKKLLQQLVAAGVEREPAKEEIRTLLSVVLLELQIGESARAEQQ